VSEVLGVGMALTALQEEGVASTKGGFGIGAVVLTLTIAVLLVWLAYLFINSRRSRRAAVEPSPLNQTPYVSDDELENVRTTRVLRAAVFAAAGLAIVLPWYAFNEADRAAQATEDLDELYIEDGHALFVRFECVGCHGADLGGGAATFVEPRTGVETSWLVPSLNDVLYRYTEDEIRYVIEYGRKGTPMPPAGLAGGGSMNEQEVDQVIAYIRDNQITQSDVVAKTDRNIDVALGSIEGAADSTKVRITQQEARIADVENAPNVLDVTGDLEDEMLDLLGGDGTCTPASAEVALTTCDNPGQDTDRDGLTDVVEPRLTEIAGIAHANLTDLSFASDGTAFPLPNPMYDVSFDPLNPFTNVDALGLPLRDLAAADIMLTELHNDVLLVRITAERQDTFLEPLRSGLSSLEEAADLMLWDVDFEQVTEDMNAAAAAAGLDDFPELTEDDAQRAVGLFNGYCSRCHTGGWSAGATFVIGYGRGAWGPAINDGRAVVQFPDFVDHADFIQNGSENAVAYGVNGIGTGRMPGFGTSLTRADIELIALYERTL
jgi:mono/diheme cytochrome c family protein